MTVDNYEWFEMANDEDRVPFLLQVLDAQLEQLPIVRRVVMAYDELRCSETSSWDDQMPGNVTARFVQRLEVDEQVALMDPTIVAAVVSVVVAYASDECRDGIVAALSSTANSLLP